MILTRRIISKLKTKEVAVIQWYTQAGNINTNLRVRIDFALPEFSAKKIMMWECYMDNSSKGIHGIFLGRYILTASILNIKTPKYIIEAVD